MVRVYGMPSCPDCACVFERIKNDRNYEIIDIGTHVRKLKEFMQIRDSDPQFEALKAAGSLGIPCFILEDGSVTLDPAEAGIRLDSEPENHYELLPAQLEALIDGIDDPVTNLSNASALLFQTLPNLNWAGFYLMKDGLLQLGPFQGRTACVRIPVGKGVCGTAAAGDRTQLVPDVHAFPGHIACDSASASEIVIPLHKNGALYGVLDIDSPVPGRFTETDQKGLEAFARVLEKFL